MDLKQKYLGNIQGDLFGGITAGIVALPLALAFGVASGLGAAAGLYGAIAVGILAALFGGTPSQISGPTGPMTVVMAGVVTALTGNPIYAFMAVALAGIFQIVMGLLRLGQFIRYIPYPVVSGFMSGIGVIIIVLQLLPLLGLKGSPSVIKGLMAIPEALGNITPAALGLGLGTIGLIYLVPRITKKIPSTLVALLVMTLVSVFARLQVPTIGAIPSGLPSIQMPDFDPALLGLIVVPALTLAALGAIDSLLTSLVADNITRTRHDSNQELIGQGLGNTLSGLIGGLPGAGATMRTVVNVKSGGRSPLSGAIHGFFLLAILLGLGPLASYIPLSVLAGILITVGIGIIDYKGLRHFLRVPRADAAVMVIVFVLTVFVDLIQAVAAGLVMACLIFVKRMSDMPVAKPAPLGPQWAQELELSEEVCKGVYIAHIEGSLFFGNAMPLQGLFSKLHEAKAIIIDLQRTPFLDQSGAYALSDIALDLSEKGVKIYLAAIPEEPAKILQLTGIAPGEIPAERIFATVGEAVQAAVRQLQTPECLQIQAQEA